MHTSNLSRSTQATTTRQTRLASIQLRFVATVLIGAGCAGGGSVTSIRVTEEPPGDNCPYGGSALATLVEGKVDSVEYLCGPEPARAATPPPATTTPPAAPMPPASLVSTEDEPPGSHCPEGGTRILSGFDLDEDGALTTEEAISVRYACHGAPGLEGSDGLHGEEGSDGTSPHLQVQAALPSECPAGGFALEVEDSDASDAAYAAADNHFTVCHGEEGAQGIPGIGVTVENAAEQCVTQGIVVTWQEQKFAVCNGLSSTIELQAVAPGGVGCNGAGGFKVVTTSPNEESTGFESDSKLICHGQSGRSVTITEIPYTPNAPDPRCRLGGVELTSDTTAHLCHVVRATADSTLCDGRGGVLLAIDAGFEELQHESICNGADGAPGIDGARGADGAPGASTSVQVVEDRSGACPYGGKRIRWYVNGAETAASQSGVYVCHSLWANHTVRGAILIDEAEDLYRFSGVRRVEGAVVQTYPGSLPLLEEVTGELHLFASAAFPRLHRATAVRIYADTNGPESESDSPFQVGFDLVPNRYPSNVSVPALTSAVTPAGVTISVMQWVSPSTKIFGFRDPTGAYTPEQPPDMNRPPPPDLNPTATRIRVPTAQIPDDRTMGRTEDWLPQVNVELPRALWGPNLKLNIAASADVFATGLEFLGDQRLLEESTEEEALQIVVNGSVNAQLRLGFGVIENLQIRTQTGTGIGGTLDVRLEALDEESAIYQLVADAPTLSSLSAPALVGLDHLTLVSTKIVDLELPDLRGPYASDGVHWTIESNRNLESIAIGRLETLTTLRFVENRRFQRLDAPDDLAPILGYGDERQATWVVGPRYIVAAEEYYPTETSFLLDPGGCRFVEQIATHLSDAALNQAIHLRRNDTSDAFAHPTYDVRAACGYTVTADSDGDDPMGIDADGVECTRKPARGGSCTHENLACWNRCDGEWVQWVWERERPMLIVEVIEFP